MQESFSKVLERYNEALQVEKSFDVVNREFTMGGRQACLYFVDGMIKDETMQKLMQQFMALKPEDMPATADEFSQKYISYVEVSLLDTVSMVVRNVLSGVPCLIVEGYVMAIAVDARTYPSRGIDEPEKDKVMRGSRDGFVETLVFNTALIRRRIRDPKLTMEYLSAGDVSHTDIVLCYMNDRVDQGFLAEIRRRIQKIKVESLTMNQQSLAECLYHHSWFNPFPKFKFSERPDTAAASVLEGDIVVLVDNSPAAMILPTTIFDIIEEADDYYFPPITGTYLRLSRFLANILALALTPLFLLLMDYPHWIPAGFEFIMVKEPVNVPVVWQFLILEFAIDGLRLAALNTPSMLSLPLSVIAALIIGDFAVGSGWFNAEPMLYMAFVALANYTQASYELGYALKFMRLITLVLTALFGIWGFGGGMLFALFCICTNRTIAGKSYLYPLIPFKWRQLAQRLFRVSLRKSEEARWKEK